MRRQRDIVLAKNNLRKMVMFREVIGDQGCSLDATEIAQQLGVDVLGPYQHTTSKATLHLLLVRRQRIVPLLSRYGRRVPVVHCLYSSDRVKRHMLS